MYDVRIIANSPNHRTGTVRREPRHSQITHSPLAHCLNHQFTTDK